MTSGKFQIIDLKIPFKRIFSEPCIIVFEGVDLKVELKSSEEIKINKEDDFRKLKDGFILFVKNKFKEELGQTASGGIADFWLVKNAIEKIFDNLQVSIKRVNILISDKKSSNTQIRVSLGELEMKTTDSAYMNAAYVTRDGKQKRHTVYKRIIFNNFMVSVAPILENHHGSPVRKILRESHP